jgi:hypothetical protein
MMLTCTRTLQNFAFTDIIGDKHPPPNIDTHQATYVPPLCKSRLWVDQHCDNLFVFPKSGNKHSLGFQSLENRSGDAHSDFVVPLGVCGTLAQQQGQAFLRL